MIVAEENLFFIEVNSGFAIGEATISSAETAAATETDKKELQSKLMSNAADGALGITRLSA